MEDMVVAFGQRKWRLSHGDCTGDESDYSLAKEGKEADKKEGRKDWLKYDGILCL